MLTLLLAVLLSLAGPLTGSSAAATGSDHPTGGGRTSQVGRYADHDAVSAASTRLTAARLRTAAPRAHLHLGAAVLPTAPTPTTHLPGHRVPGALLATAVRAPRGGTLSRAPPA